MIIKLIKTSNSEMMKKTIQTTLLILAIWLALIVSACTSEQTSVSEMPIQANTVSESAELPEATLLPSTEGILSVVDVEKLAGFDVKEPAYLPSGVSYQTAVFQNSPSPLVILQYKLVHEQFGEMGSFFHLP